MGRRRFLAACLAIILTFAILARDHVRDLVEVARTYSSFYPYLKRHPEVVFKLPQPVLSTEHRGSQVPRVIHQILLTSSSNSVLSEHTPAIESCKALHPEWSYYLWTDDNATNFMREQYPSLLKHYEEYDQSIQRANVLRYAVLEHHGGVYLDLDITCLAPLDNLIHLPWLTPGAYPAGVNNAFILTRPHHHLLKEVLAKIPSSDLEWGMPYVENMLSTGCMYLSNRWMSYSRRLGELGTVAEIQKVYVLADQEGNLEPYMLRGKVTTALFAHGGASSWHGWDAALIILIGKHYGYFLLLIFSCLGFWTGMWWRLLGASTRRSRDWMSKNQQRISSCRWADVEQLPFNCEASSPCRTSTPS